MGNENFSGKIVKKIFIEGKIKAETGLHIESLTLVQDDYLGGYGSRGSGQVKFEIDKLLYKDRKIYENNQEAKEYTEHEIPEQLKPKENKK